MVEIGSEKRTRDLLRAIPEVKEAQMVHGAYDIIVRIESDTKSNLKDVIRGKIRNLEKVRSTLTMIVTNVIVER